MLSRSLSDASVTSSSSHILLYAEQEDAPQWVILKLHPFLRTPGYSISKNIIDVFSETRDTPLLHEDHTCY